MMKELYRFSEAKRIPPFSLPQNFYFVIDKSGSMAEQVGDGSTTRFQVLVEQMKQVVSNLNDLRIEKGVSVDMGFCAFSGTSTETLEKRDFQTSNIAEVEAWLDGLTAGGGTPYDAPMSEARSYFLDVVRTGYKQSLYFITDGLPEPEATAYDAASENEDMISKTGSFSEASGNAVDIYGVGLDLYDTTFLGLLDNTAVDGISVVNTEKANSLFNLILATTSQGANTWTVTSADSDEVYGGEVYVSTAIGRNDIQAKSEMSKANIEVKVSIDNEFGRRWLNKVIDSVVSLNIFEKTDSNVRIIWKGRLSSVKPEDAEIILVFESIFTSLRRPGLRKRYQRSCPYVLYGRGCKLNRLDYQTESVVTSIVGNVVTCPEAASFADGYFTTGILEDQDGNLRFIVSHVGDKITLVRPLLTLNERFASGGYGLSYGQSYGGVRSWLYPGCDRTRQTCNSKFNNLPNFGGFPFIPLKNPFGGGAIV